jgi:hypothetical protein
MTKTVFSRNDMVAHIWGQQSQDRGRSPTPSGAGRFGFVSGASSADIPRVSFKGRIFYSYREPVARLVENGHGVLCLIYTAGQLHEYVDGRAVYRSWSPSTDGHVGAAVSAVSHLVDARADKRRGTGNGRVWQVPDIGGHPYGGPESGWEGTPREPDHLTNLDYLADQFRAAVKRYSGRAKIYRDHREGVDWAETIGNDDARYYSEAETVQRRLRDAWAATLDYADAFLSHCGDDRTATLGRDFPRTFKAVDKLAADIMTEREARAARALAKLTPAELARREAAKAERAERRKREERLRFADAAEKLEGWRDGLNIRNLYPNQDGNGGAFIRAKGVRRNAAGEIISGTLETSQGADVPLTHAIRAFRFLKLCRERGRGWETNGRTIRVGHFNISRVARGPVLYGRVRNVRGRRRRTYRPPCNRHGR